MTGPAVSVVIACRDYGRFLPEALESVRSQTWRDWECIVVDDASSDDTAEIARAAEAADSRFRYHHLPINRGEAGARNAGIALARGTWIASLDADDWWHEDKLTRQLALVREDPQAVLCCTAPLLMPGSRPAAEPGYFAAWVAELDVGLRRENNICHSSVLMRRDWLERLGGYDEQLPYAVDWDLWLRVLVAGGPAAIRFLDEPLTRYRQHGGNMSGQWRLTGRGMRRVVRRYLARDGWGWRHPAGALAVMAAELDRETRARLDAGARGPALLTAGAWLALSPFRRWRWARLAALFEPRAGSHSPKP